MGQVLLGEQDVLGLGMTVPRWGVPQAQIEISNEGMVPGGAQQLVIGGEAWKGVVLSKGPPFATRTRLWWVGGAGGYGKTTVGPYAYQDLPLGEIVGDLLRACGETLSSTADADVLGLYLAGPFVLRQQIGGQALKEVLDVAGAVWRVLQDGTTWIGRETWPEADVEASDVWDALDADFGRRWVEFAPETTTMQPGTAYKGLPISSVTYELDGEVLRGRCALEIDR